MAAAGCPGKPAAGASLPTGASVDLVGLADGLRQALEAEAGLAGGPDQHGLAPGDLRRRLGHGPGDLERHDHGAVAVGMDEVAGTHGHPGDGDGKVETLDVAPGVRRADL